MDPVRVHDKVCDQVHEKERARMSEAVSQLILGICDAARARAAETISMVVGCLSELAEKGVDVEDERATTVTRRTMQRSTRRWQQEGWDRLVMCQ